jgi:hypothetical protein
MISHEVMKRMTGYRAIEEKTLFLATLATTPYWVEKAKTNSTVEKKMISSTVKLIAIA